jgi:hypothetical protein
MLIVQDKECMYTLAQFGDAVIVEDVLTGDICQVDVKEMSPFELDVYQFLIANN